MSHPLLFSDGVKGRDPIHHFKIDVAALHALLQAAVNVELFTIPLYMTSLYSLYGTHTITSKDNDFYKGRRWPGMSPSRKSPSPTPNEEAFNAVFSVFVAEMLHLQLVSNLCDALNYEPAFTSDALVYQPNEIPPGKTKEQPYGWRCYGPEVTVLPHILDFKDTNKPHIRVDVGPLNDKQVELFLIIEETEGMAHDLLLKDLPPQYDSTVPFKGWTPAKRAKHLPMFRSIGNMYYRLWEYLSMEYTDGETLWDKLYAGGEGYLQQEVFNSGEPNMHEYPKMPTHITFSQESIDPLEQVIQMINGITEQGEGHGVVQSILARARSGAQDTSRVASVERIMKVQEQFQPDKPNLERKYPSYNSSGKDLNDSAKAYARSHYGAVDHYAVFKEVQALLEKTPADDKTKGIYTWEDWHADPKHRWNKTMLEVEGEVNPYPHLLPGTDAISDALNRLKENDAQGENFKLFSHTAAGAIAGVTRVLNDYFGAKGSSTEFPFPSMGGSGDRMAICWAIFGKAPNLALGVLPRVQEGVAKDKELFHACQGMAIGENVHDDPNQCASAPIFHTCKGSNECKTEGGCGFVQSIYGGSGCGQPKDNLFKDTAKEKPALIGQPLNVYTTPANNACSGLGGCAVPISASQMYPELYVKPGTTAPASLMQRNDISKAYPYPVTQARRTGYPKGELVYQTAWNGYIEVLKANGVKEADLPKQPPISDLRLAFTPST